MVLESRTRKGSLGEDCAIDTLTVKGYRILARNWRGGRGEVDVLAQDGNVVVAVEVKSRSGCGTGLDPSHWMPSVAQQQRIVRATHAFLRQRPGGLTECRFDVLLVEIEGSTGRVLVHFQGAFDACSWPAKPHPRASVGWKRLR